MTKDLKKRNEEGEIISLAAGGPCFLTPAPTEEPPNGIDHVYRDTIKARKAGEAAHQYPAPKLCKKPLTHTTQKPATSAHQPALGPEQVICWLGVGLDSADVKKIQLVQVGHDMISKGWKQLKNLIYSSMLFHCVCVLVESLTPKECLMQ